MSIPDTALEDRGTRLLNPVTKAAVVVVIQLGKMPAGRVALVQHPAVAARILVLARSPRELLRKLVELVDVPLEAHEMAARKGVENTHARVSIGAMTCLWTLSASKVARHQLVDLGAIEAVLDLLRTAQNDGVNQRWIPRPPSTTTPARPKSKLLKGRVPGGSPRKSKSVAIADGSSPTKSMDTSVALLEPDTFEEPRLLSPQDCQLVMETAIGAFTTLACDAYGRRRLYRPVYDVTTRITPQTVWDSLQTCCTKLSRDGMLGSGTLMAKLQEIMSPSCRDMGDAEQASELVTAALCVGLTAIKEVHGFDSFQHFDVYSFTRNVIEAVGKEDVVRGMRVPGLPPRDQRWRLLSGISCLSSSVELAQRMVDAGILSLLTGMLVDTALEAPLVDQALGCYLKVAGHRARSCYDMDAGLQSTFGADLVAHGGLAALLVLVEREMVAMERASPGEEMLGKRRSLVVPTLGQDVQFAFPWLRLEGAAAALMHICTESNTLERMDIARIMSLHSRGKFQEKMYLAVALWCIARNAENCAVMWEMECLGDEAWCLNIVLHSLMPWVLQPEERVEDGECAALRSHAYSIVEWIVAALLLILKHADAERKAQQEEARRRAKARKEAEEKAKLVKLFELWNKKVFTEADVALRKGVRGLGLSAEQEALERRRQERTKESVSMKRGVELGILTQDALLEEDKGEEIAIKDKAFAWRRNAKDCVVLIELPEDRLDSKMDSSIRDTSKLMVRLATWHIRGIAAPVLDANKIVLIDANNVVIDVNNVVIDVNNVVIDVNNVVIDVNNVVINENNVVIDVNNVVMEGSFVGEARMCQLITLVHRILEATIEPERLKAAEGLHGSRFVHAPYTLRTRVPYMLGTCAVHVPKLCTEDLLSRSAVPALVRLLEKFLSHKPDLACILLYALLNLSTRPTGQLQICRLTLDTLLDINLRREEVIQARVPEKLGVELQCISSTILKNLELHADNRTILYKREMREKMRRVEEETVQEEPEDEVDAEHEAEVDEDVGQLPKHEQVKQSFLQWSEDTFEAPAQEEGWGVAVTLPKLVTSKATARKERRDEPRKARYSSQSAPGRAQRSAAAAAEDGDDDGGGFFLTGMDETPPRNSEEAAHLPKISQRGLGSEEPSKASRRRKKKATSKSISFPPITGKLTGKSVKRSKSARRASERDDASLVSVVMSPEASRLAAVRQSMRTSLRNIWVPVAAVAPNLVLPTTPGNHHVVHADGTLQEIKRETWAPRVGNTKLVFDGEVEIEREGEVNEMEIAACLNPDDAYDKKPPILVQLEGRGGHGRGLERPRNAFKFTPSKLSLKAKFSKSEPFVEIAEAIDMLVTKCFLPVIKVDGSNGIDHDTFRNDRFYVEEMDLVLREEQPFFKATYNYYKGLRRKKRMDLLGFMQMFEECQLVSGDVKAVSVFPREVLTCFVKSRTTVVEPYDNKDKNEGLGDSSEVDGGAFSSEVDGGAFSSEVDGGALSREVDGGAFSSEAHFYQTTKTLQDEMEVALQGPQAPPVTLAMMAKSSIPSAADVADMLCHVPGSLFPTVPKPHPPAPGGPAGSHLPERYMGMQFFVTGEEEPGGTKRYIARDMQWSVVRFWCYPSLPMTWPDVLGGCGAQSLGDAAAEERVKAQVMKHYRLWSAIYEEYSLLDEKSPFYMSLNQWAKLCYDFNICDDSSKLCKVSDMDTFFIQCNLKTKAKKKVRGTIPREGREVDGGAFSSEVDGAAFSSEVDGGVFRSEVDGAASVIGYVDWMEGFCRVADVLSAVTPQELKQAKVEGHEAPEAILKYAELAEAAMMEVLPRRKSAGLGAVPTRPLRAKVAQLIFVVKARLCQRYELPNTEALLKKLRQDNKHEPGSVK
eukprot:gene6941-8280_t